MLFLCVSGIKCPVCNKFVPPDDIECHLVVCLTKPRITYNGKSTGVPNKTRITYMYTGKSCGVPNINKNYM